MGGTSYKTINLKCFSFQLSFGHSNLCGDFLVIVLEAFDKGAWWDVELLAIQKGNLLVHFFGYGDKEVPLPFVRHRLRRACDHDCGHFLKPGIDVAVYSTLPSASDMNNAFVSHVYHPSFLESNKKRKCHFLL